MRDTAGVACEIKFIYYQKAINFDKTSTFYLELLNNVQKSSEIS
jgi:hypothetical protein